MSYPRYPAYKQSGVEWLGEVPSTWSVQSLRRLFKITNGSTPSSDKAEYWDGDIPWLTPEDIGKLQDKFIFEARRNITIAGYSSCGTQLVAPGSIVLTTRAPIGNIGLTQVAACTNQGCKALVPLNGVSSLFFYYALLSFSPLLQALGKGSTFLELSTVELTGFSVPVPTPDEQSAIAAFLDRETAQIDALIAKQERLISLLHEKRQALISHAVTRGLDPAAPLKQSGVAWLGEVPAHWEVAALKKALVGIDQGNTMDSDNRIADLDEWGVLKSGCVNRGVFREDEHKALTAAAVPNPDFEVKAGDILMSRASGSLELVGSVAFVEQVQRRLVLSDKVFRLAPSFRFEPRYLALLMNSRSMRAQIELSANGADGLPNNITRVAIQSLVAAIPPRVEQVEMLAILDTELGRIDSLIERGARVISLLQERRAALIAAAVTGQIDVRGA